MVKKILNILAGDYYPYQKINYIKHLLSKRTPVLKYKPMTVSIVSTSRCTLACDMCPTHSKIVPKDYRHRQTAAKDMDFELFKKTLDLFREALSVHIIGAGEPMLNKDFFKMVEYASRRCKMEVKTFTNGTTIRENMESLLNSELDGFTVSINGHNKAEFSRMTGMPESVFEKIYNDTKELVREKNVRNSKLQVKLSFIIDKINYKFLPEMVKLSEELNVDYTFLCSFLPCPYGELDPKKRVITSDDRQIVEYIRNFKKSLPAVMQKKIEFSVAVENKMLENKCDIHFDQVRVDGDGKTSSCSMMLLNMENAGSIDEKDVWNSKFLVGMRRNFLENKDLDELCYYCPSNKGMKI